ncbi:MAG: hypothetical protein VW687_12455 [Curvibacter sp.]
MRLFVTLVFLLLAWPAAAQSSERDLVLELREIEEGGGGYVVGTQSQVPLMAPQQLQVRNGGAARLSFSQTTPLQWVQSVQAPGAMTGAGVKQGLIWLQAGQSLQFKPRWPGGNRPATVEVEVQTTSVQQQPGRELPSQARSELSTTVQAPLGQWVTLARSGNLPQPGVYSSNAATQRPRLLQLRVSAP